MITLPLNQYALLISLCACLGILLVYFIIVSLMNSRRLARDAEEREKARAISEMKQNEILERARYDYEAIIRSATQKAEDIIKDANRIKEESKGTLDDDYNKLLMEQRLKLAETTEELEGKYKEQIEEMNRQNVQLLQSAYKDIIDYSTSTLGVFKEDMEKETFDSKKLADVKIQEQYGKLDAELEEKRKEAIERINQNISKVLLFVSKEAFGKNIKLEDQQQLILQSLDRAKKELLT